MGFCSSGVPVDGIHRNITRKNWKSAGMLLVSSTEKIEG